ncbi:UNVERIFIED_ORG: hypothetical protein QOE_0055 [Clostridioides difficile F501]
MRSMLPLQISFDRYRFPVGLRRGGREFACGLIFAWPF